jgi:hypothetical protein
LIDSQALVAYPDQDIRLAMSRAVAIETPRGWRIGKDRSSHKVDVIIALAMSTLAAVRAEKEPYFDKSWAWVSGVPIGGDALTDAERAERRRQESADWYQARLHAYLAQHGGFGFGPPFGRI